MLLPHIIGTRTRGVMGILREFENRLENLVEGFFARVLPGGGVQPIELGKRMVRAMGEDQTRAVSGQIFVPNVFEFRLAEPDYDRLEQIGSQLRKELTAVAKRAAASERWEHAGPIEITLRAEPNMRKGTFEVDASYKEGTRPEQPVGAHTQLIEMSLAADAEVVLLGKAPQTWPLSKQTLILGRSEGNDIVIPDQGVSRRHAEIRKEGDEWVIIDLGSTNGTEINGKPVNRHRLAHGDRLTLGESHLEFRRN
ncbi:MAG: FhaA domain-containing protein [Actinomycetota bacterium]